MLGNNFFIGGNNMPATGESPFYILQGRVFTTNSLNNDIYLRVSKEIVIISGKKLRLHLPGLRPG